MSLWYKNLSSVDEANYNWLFLGIAFTLGASIASCFWSNTFFVILIGLVTLFFTKLFLPNIIEKIQLYSLFKILHKLHIDEKQIIFWLLNKNYERSFSREDFDNNTLDLASLLKIADLNLVKIDEDFFDKELYTKNTIHLKDPLWSIIIKNKLLFENL